jgi:hypothetical protein
MPNDTRVKATRELGRRAAAVGTKVAFEEFRTAEEQAELVAALEDMDVIELEDVRDLIDEIIDAKLAAEVQE